jgi:hypothetical protein
MAIAQRLNAGKSARTVALDYELEIAQTRHADLFECGGRAADQLRRFR